MVYKILVVDDEPDLELLITQKFRNKIISGELIFEFAQNGAEALEKLKDNPAIDLVLSDINMPVMDGLTLLSRIQEMFLTQKAVIISAYGDIRNIRTAMNRGAFDFIMKPIDFRDLEITLNKTFQEIIKFQEAIEIKNKLEKERQEKEEFILNQNKILEQKVKERTQQLVQQERLASLGQLTAGIAHEIKNPLNFVNNFAELSMDLIADLKVASTEDDKNRILNSLQQLLGKINEHGKRADSIIKNMLEHSRGSSGEKQEVNINQLSEEYYNLAYHGMRSRCRGFNCVLEKQIDESIPMLNLIPQDISRVLLNLFNNAFYAVNERSQGMEYRGGDEESYQPSVLLTTKRNENTVSISVRDNGKGIPAEIRDKIFDPFFTTKPAGEGTGLGLSLSYDIIKYHDGEMKVDSKLNEYTEFEIVLPLN